MENQPKRIPVTILTGFLGAGKTTLLNRIIKQNEGKKLAIIENEFGQVPIDSELVIKSEEGIFELSNGCVCCSLNGELVSILLKLVNGQRQVDHLIIETTGIADPGPIALNFITDYKIQTMFRLDAIVTLADARFIEQQLESEEEAGKQVALADIILVNKTDAVEKYQLDAVKNIIARLNPQAELKECSYGEVEGLNLLEINAFSRENVLKTKFETTHEAKSKGKYAIDKQAIENPGSLLGNRLAHHHASKIGSHSFVFDEPLEVLKFDTWIKIILNAGFNQIYRAKGILQIEDFDKKVIFQSVNDQYVTESGGNWGDEPRQTKIVFIGKNLDRELLEKGLKSCTVNGIDAMDEAFYAGIIKLQEEMYNRLKELA